MARAAGAAWIMIKASAASATVSQPECCDREKYTRRAKTKFPQQDNSVSLDLLKLQQTVIIKGRT
jgi:hypothetical protein